MMKKIALFWPGDYRPTPNDQAIPSAEEATLQMESALKKLGCSPYRVEGFLTKPNQAINKLGPVQDPMVGVCVHWCYGPHTVDGVVGKENPLLLASNFSGQWPGLVGLLNTGACLESVNRDHSRIWTDAKDWTKDDFFLSKLEVWLESGKIPYGEEQIKEPPPVSGQAQTLADRVCREIRKKRILALMLGDTSMGMINGYFGPRRLYPIGFSEHKVDQAWLIDRGKKIDQSRIDRAYSHVCSKGVTFHYKDDFDENATKEQLRDYLTVLDLMEEFEADCLGWQYQLGLVPLRPPSDFSEGLLNSTCRPEGDGETVVCSTEGDQGNLIPMELMKRLLIQKGLNPSVMFHDVRWGAEHGDRFLWVLLNSGSCGAYAFNHDPESLKGVHSYRQPKGYFPIPGGTFAGRSQPGKLTWSRAYLRDNRLWMDVGRGESVELPDDVCESWWGSTTREWPFMAADLEISRDTLMAHYQSNHIAVAYGDIFEEMVSLSQSLGFEVRVLSGR